MQISFDINLTEQEESQIAKVIECEKEELEKKLKQYAQSAMNEYIDMFLGRTYFRTVADTKEIRLLKMIQHVFNGDIPNEYKVSKIFHITISQARSLIRSVIAKYQHELDEIIISSYKNLVENCKQKDKDEPFEVVIQSLVLVDGLNQILSNVDGRVPKIVRKHGTSGIYVINISSYDKLREYLNMPKRGS